MTDRYIHDEALRLCRFEGYTLDSAIIEAATRYREIHPSHEDDPPLQRHSWEPPPGRMVGAERNG